MEVLPVLPVLPVFAPPSDPPNAPDWGSVEDIQAALSRVRGQKLRLENRERQLLQALAAASRGRVQEIVQAGGLPAPALEGMLRRAVDSSRRHAAEPPASAEAAALRTRKAPLRYRHPDDPGRVWSGRGKTPRWVAELLAQGRLELARIQPDEPS
jgi:DNA-binding protein H-NS